MSLPETHWSVDLRTSELAAQIIGVLDDRALTVRKAEDMAGIAATDFSRIRKTMFCAMHFLAKLLYSQDIVFIGFVRCLKNLSLLDFTACRSFCLMFEIVDGLEAAPRLWSSLRHWTNWLKLSNSFKSPFHAHGLCVKIQCGTSTPFSVTAS